ncbi:hypothetical protein AKO1_000431, partial [Acrasis kona]
KTQIEKFKTIPGLRLLVTPSDRINIYQSPKLLRVYNMLLTMAVFKLLTDDDATFQASTAGFDDLCSLSQARMGIADVANLMGLSVDKSSGTGAVKLVASYYTMHFASMMFNNYQLKSGFLLPLETGNVEYLKSNGDLWEFVSKRAITLRLTYCSDHSRYCDLFPFLKGSTLGDCAFVKPEAVVFQFGGITAKKPKLAQIKSFKGNIYTGAIHTSDFSSYFEYLPYNCVIEPVTKCSNSFDRMIKLKDNSGNTSVIWIQDRNRSDNLLIAEIDNELNLVSKLFGEQDKIHIYVTFMRLNSDSMYDKLKGTTNTNQVDQKYIRATNIVLYNQKMKQTKIKENITVVLLNNEGLDDFFGKTNMMIFTCLKMGSKIDIYQFEEYLDFFCQVPSPKKLKVDNQSSALVSDVQQKLDQMKIQELEQRQKVGGISQSGRSQEQTPEQKQAYQELRNLDETGLAKWLRDRRLNEKAITALFNQDFNGEALASVEKDTLEKLINVGPVSIIARIFRRELGLELK